MPGERQRLTGWGVEVRLPGRRRWFLLTKPGQEQLLSTHLAGARAWAEDYRQRGCSVRLVELDLPRGPCYREQPPEAPEPLTLPLFT